MAKAKAKMETETETETAERARATPCTLSPASEDPTSHPRPLPLVAALAGVPPSAVVPGAVAPPGDSFVQTSDAQSVGASIPQTS
jgi:hypothetical protein